MNVAKQRARTHIDDIVMHNAYVRLGKDDIVYARDPIELEECRLMGDPCPRCREWMDVCKCPRSEWIHECKGTIKSGTYARVSAPPHFIALNFDGPKDLEDPLSCSSLAYTDAGGFLPSSWQRIRKNGAINVVVVRKAIMDVPVKAKAPKHKHKRKCKP